MTKISIVVKSDLETRKARICNHSGDFSRFTNKRIKPPEYFEDFFVSEQAAVTFAEKMKSEGYIDEIINEVEEVEANK